MTKFLFIVIHELMFKRNLYLFIGILIVVFSIYLSATLTIKEIPSKEEIMLMAPHKTCLLGNEIVIEKLTDYDFRIFASYMFLGTACVVSFFILWFTRWYYQLLSFLFGCFVLFCGFGHYIDTRTMFENWYYYKIIIGSITDTVSVLTTIYGIVLIPFLVKDIVFIWRTLKSI